MQFSKIRVTVLSLLVMGLALASSPPAFAQSLIAQWKLDESSGTSASDSTGNGYTGTVGGTATWTSGMINNCFSFNGSSKITLNSLFGNPASVTLACWVKTTATDTAGAEAMSIGDYVVLRAHAVANGGPNVSVYQGSGAWTSVGVATNYVGAGWHHFVLTFDNTSKTLSFYIDGALKGSTTASSSIVWSGLGTQTRLGTHGNTRTDLDLTGMLDDARVYNYALSAADVLDLYGKLAHWKLDEASGTSAADSSAYSRTGTVTGTASWISAVVRNGFSFNGTTKIQASGLLNSPTSVSATAWANLTTAGTSGAEVISLGDHFGLRLDSGGVSKVFFYNGSSYVTASVSTVYAGTGWHHFAGVFDNANNSLKLYVDGVLAATTSTASTISYSGLGSNTVIGRHGNASTSYDFTGTIDDVRVYNYALSAAEVIDIYGLVGYWKLNEASGTSAADASGNSYTGTVTGTASWVSGIFGNGFSFNGSTKVQASGLMGSPASFTLAAWVNLTGAGGNGAEVISLGDHAALRLDVSSSTRAYFYDGSAWQKVSYSKTYAGTGWHHFAGVFDGDTNTYTLYVDGVQVASATFATTVSFAGLGSNTVIGRHGNGGSGYDLTGTVDDVRVYNYPLSASAIAELYGLIGYWKLDEASGTSASDSSGMGRTGTVTGTSTWTSSIINNGFSFNGSTKIQVSNLLSGPRSVSAAAWVNLTTVGTSGSEVVSLGDHFSVRLDEGSVSKVYYYNGTSAVALSVNQTFAGQGWHHLVAIFDADNSLMKLYVDGELAGSTAAASSISFAGLGRNTVIGQHGNGSSNYNFNGKIDEVRVYNRVLTNSEIVDLHGLIGRWKLTETSGTTSTDTTLNASNGTYLNGVSLGTSTNVPGYNVTAAVFDGTNDYVSVPNPSLYKISGTVSAAAWIKVGVFDKNWQAIFAKGDTSWRLARETTTNNATFAVNGLTPYKVTTVSSVNDNKWHHIAGVYNGSNLKIYLDGALNATASTTGSPTTNNYAVYIGENAEVTGRQFNGAIYDARVYNRAITAEEVTQLYGTGFAGVKITKWTELQ